jgi:hypothetical protein
MPISKDGSGTIVYTAPERKDLFELTGVAQSNQFAVCDKVDVLKQIALDPSSQTTNTTVTIKSGSGNVANVVLTLPTTSGTLATSAGSGDSFNIIQTPSGTAPTATGQSTLTLTSSDSSVTIIGDSVTDTIDFKASAGITALTGDVTATGPGSSVATIGAGKVTDTMIVGVAASKVSGNISGNAANITASSNSTLTTLSSLSLPLTQTTGTLGETRGGTNQTSYAKGDIVHATAANTLGKLAIGTQGQSPVVLSAGTLGYENPVNLSTRTVFWASDFIGGNQPADTAVGQSGTGAASGSDITQTAANPGIWKILTGTTTGGWAYLSANNSSSNLFLGGGLTTFEVIEKLSALSDGTDTYLVTLGLINTQISTPVNGVYFTYSHGTNSGNWTFNCTKASSTTSVDTGVAASASAYQRLTWVMNSAGTSVQAYVNGVAAGAAITTNIPIAALQPCFQIVKSAGTTSRTIFLDAYALQIHLAVAR